MFLDVVVAGLDIVREKRLKTEFCKAGGYERYTRNFYHGTAHMRELDEKYDLSKKVFLNGRRNNKPFKIIMDECRKLEHLHRISNKVEAIGERRKRALRDVAPLVCAIDRWRLPGLIGDVPFDVLDVQCDYAAASARQTRWIEAGLPGVGATTNALENRLTNYVMQNSNQPLGFTDDPNFRFRYNSKRAQQVSKSAHKSLRKLEAITKRQVLFERVGYKIQQMVPA